MINEILIISGKGGTGKTSLTASIIPHFENIVLADCDVDAPDLKILFDGKIIEELDFIGLKKAELNKDLCIDCKKCYNSCKFDAIDEEISINSMKCEGCGLCEYVCPVNAIQMKDWKVGKIFTSDTDYGTMVHARLIPGEETSGRLVAEVRKKAKKIAEKNNIKNILIDGSPGIACNVISSMTGVKKVIIVTEPTLSALHDLKRVYQLTQKFNLKVLLVINKYDISKEISKKIEIFAKENNIDLSLKIPYDESILKAIINKKIPSLYNKKLFDEIGFNQFIEKLKTP